MTDARADRMSERDEIESLLPWYVSGKLDAKERARVERYVEAHPEIRSHLALAREESEATLVANEAIAPPGPQALDRLRTSIAAMPRRRPFFSQIFERLADWISGLEPHQLALGAAAAALAFMLQATVIGALVLERAGAPTYHTAGGEDVVGDTFDLLVGFSETATVGEISAVLKQLDAVVVDGPKAGLYRLRLPDQGNEARKAAIELLQKSGLVTAVLPER